MADLTIGEVIERLFPRNAETGDAYFAWPRLDGSNPDAYETPPAYPPDLFAAAAYLVQLSGAYHHVRGSPREAGAVVRQVVLDEADRERCRRCAGVLRGFDPEAHHDQNDETVFAQWAASPEMQHLYALWSIVFGEAKTQRVFTPLSAQDEAPSWWKPAVELLIISDEASANVGWVVSRRRPESWPELIFNGLFTEQMTSDSTSGETRVTPLKSLTGAAPDMLTVLPKARTASVGCTLRSLSCNLALLPPRGVARDNWSPYLFRDTPSAHRHLNLLLVPFPYSVKATDFHHDETFTSPNGAGFFDIRQSWLELPDDPTRSRTRSSAWCPTS